MRAQKRTRKNPHDVAKKIILHGNKAQCFSKSTQDQQHCHHGTKRLSSDGFNIQNGSDIWAEHQLSGWEGVSEQWQNYTEDVALNMALLESNKYLTQDVSHTRAI